MKLQIEMNFNTLVDDAYLIIDKQSRGENLILPEVVIDIGPTRLHWKNVKAFLKVVRRHPDHFIGWLKSELPNKEINWFSGSKSDGLIIHGKRQRKSNITELVRKYVSSYVVCPSCKHVDTQMYKCDHKQYEFECIDCGMKKFVT
jgi:translation initiation factor 2 beta subunit (eIF-2beta)/eIF-5